MAVKGKRCLNIKSSEWISSSFSDSFGLSPDNDDGNLKSPGKRAKFDGNNSFDDFDISQVDLACIENELKLEKNNKIVAKSSAVWCEKYKPKNVDELVINKKKILEVENWLKSGFLYNDRYNKNKILLITGPTGCGKTCTLSVVCKSLGFDVSEWVTPMDITYNCNYGDESDFVLRQRPVSQLFDEFILRSSKYTSLLSLDNDRSDKKIVLVKDFPNVLLNKPEMFHEILDRYYNNCNANFHISPLVFVISCPNIVRELFSDEIKGRYSVTTINFNSVTETNVVKALNRILLLESKNSSSKFKISSKDELVHISDCSDGDLRSAILKLQFSLDNAISNFSNNTFKVPKSLSQDRERIKVKKSSSLSGHKVYEIDKDKKLDFFNSIGRVLYPKKEIIDTVGECSDKNKYKFVHSPDSIAETFLTEPNKFVNMLHENYLDRFTNIKDVSVAALNFSLSDFLLSSSWEGRDVMVQYSLSVVVRTLMTSNSSPAPNSWKPLSKSKIWVTENNKRENLNAIRRIFPDVQSEKDVLLDVIPFIKKLNVNLSPDEKDIISKISHYNKQVK